MPIGLNNMISKKKHSKPILNKTQNSTFLVLIIEIELGSLRVTLEQQISETEWAQSRFD